VHDAPAALDHLPFLVFPPSLLEPCISASRLVVDRVLDIDPVDGLSPADMNLYHIFSTAAEAEHLEAFMRDRLITLLENSKARFKGEQDSPFDGGYWSDKVELLATDVPTFVLTDKDSTSPILDAVIQVGQHINKLSKSTERE
jgi:hypothetical protein